MALGQPAFEKDTRLLKWHCLGAWSWLAQTTWPWNHGSWNLVMALPPGVHASLRWDLKDPWLLNKWKPKYNVWDCIRHWRKWKRLPSGPVHVAIALHHNQRCRHVERQHKPLCLKSQPRHAAVKQILVATCQILMSTSHMEWSIINNQQQIANTQ